MQSSLYVKLSIFLRSSLNIFYSSMSGKFFAFLKTERVSIRTSLLIALKLLIKSPVSFSTHCFSPVSVLAQTNRSLAVSYGIISTYLKILTSEEKITQPLFNLLIMNAISIQSFIYCEVLGISLTTFSSIFCQYISSWMLYFYPKVAYSCRLAKSDERQTVFMTWLPNYWNLNLSPIQSGTLILLNTLTRSRTCSGVLANYDQ